MFLLIATLLTIGAHAHSGQVTSTNSPPPLRIEPVEQFDLAPFHGDVPPEIKLISRIDVEKLASEVEILPPEAAGTRLEGLARQARETIRAMEGHGPGYHDAYTRLAEILITALVQVEKTAPPEREHPRPARAFENAAARAARFGYGAAFLGGATFSFAHVSDKPAFLVIGILGAGLGLLELNSDAKRGKQLRNVFAFADSIRVTLRNGLRSALEAAGGVERMRDRMWLGFIREVAGPEAVLEISKLRKARKFRKEHVGLLCNLLLTR